MASLVLLYAETPLHAGAGTRVSYVDLPVQRERITNFPMIQSSSLKGVLRWEAFQRAKRQKDEWDFKKVAIVFGPGEDLKKHADDDEVKKLDSSEFGGAISLTDARILLFPVRSLRGVFAWVTCPLVLKRLARDLRLIEGSVPEALQPDMVEQIAENTLGDGDILVTQNSSVVVVSKGERFVVLEDFQFLTGEGNKDLEKFASALAVPYQDSNPLVAGLSKRIAVVRDDVFQELVEMTTEVISRIRIDPVTGTVAQGALWTEELVPSEALFWTVIQVSSPTNGKAQEWNLNDGEMLTNLVKQITDDQVLQFGGDETLGRGWLRLRWIP